MNYSSHPISDSPFTSKSNNNQLNEQCPIITGNLNNGPANGCTSPWNNMTKRKSLVKDY